MVTAPERTSESIEEEVLCAVYYCWRNPLLYYLTFGLPLSGWLSGLLEKNWSREEYRNRPLLRNRVSERDYVQILKA
jgi:hypothetical protein